MFIKHKEEKKEKKYMHHRAGKEIWVATVLFVLTRH